MPTPDELLFPALEPYAQDLLPVTFLHSIYYEQCGNPDGYPVVILHGGPGSGCTPMQRRFFDPQVYRIILFDQRGCKRSQPAGCIEDNTTAALIEDMEALRRHLNISQWMVFGGSWGSTLALAYAEMHPAAVSELILRGIFLCRPQELEWFFYEVRHFFPDAWERFVAPLPVEEREDIVAAYRKRIFSDDAGIALNAAISWGNFEAEIMSLLPSAANPTPATPEDTTVIGRARVQLHYLSNMGFIDGQEILARIDTIRNIPAKIIQGRYDMVCPPCTAFELHQAWPEAEFTIIPDAGHSAMEPGIVKALMAAAKSFHPK
jgi:proline iminopeptidase